MSINLMILAAQHRANDNHTEYSIVNDNGSLEIVLRSNAISSNIIETFYPVGIK